MSVLAAILWYLIITLTGWLAFPLAFRLFKHLPDRGYGLSRALGLLGWGYGFWLLASLQIGRNDIGTILLAGGLLAGAAVYALRKTGTAEMREWLRQQRGMILTVEALFLGAFIFMAVVRAANPEVLGTEKPMELAFINAILRSESFPPHDPWLSGYAISYYYFGYVLVGMLAKLSMTPGAIAHNLGTALVFALGAVGAYSLAYNLLKKKFGELKGLALASLLAPFNVLVLSNLGGLLEVLHNRGLFWTSGAQGASSAFWSWLNLKELNQPPAEPFGWAPDRFYWWWRSSRVVNDVNLAGQAVEVIDEFPFFSFLLGDLHPHVLALPFAFLAMALGLELFWQSGEDEIRLGRFSLRMGKGFLLGSVWMLGALAFLNTWDFPIYVALFCGVYALRQAHESGWRWNRLWEFLGLGLLAGAGGVLLYLPFYFGFSSQAGGVMPNLIYATSGAQLWVMFGTLLIPLAGFLFYAWRKSEHKPSWKLALGLSLGLIAGLWALSLVFGYVITLLPTLGANFINLHGASDSGLLFSAAITRRLSAPGGWLSLAALLTLTFGLLAARKESLQEVQPAAGMAYESERADRYIYLMVGIGLLLVLAPEFIYLRDQFSTRMNTVFKFYYQAWLLWGVAAAYASTVLLVKLKGGWRAGYQVLLAAVLLAGGVYPYFGLLTKTNQFQPVDGWTLDGSAFLARSSSDDLAAANWLLTAEMGVIAEAVGGQYSNYARMATFSGMPNVLGWPGHESQWRGGASEMGSREGDLERLYCTDNWEEAQEILVKYDIRYVVVGALESGKYQAGSANCLRGVQIEKFQRVLPAAFQMGSVTVFENP